MLLAPCILLLVVAQHLAAADTAATVDLRRGVPEDVYLVVQGKHNPERDFQRKYYDEVWKTVLETQIIDRVVKIATSRMEEGQLAQAKAVMAELRKAAEPIKLEELFKAQEVVYAQQMQMSPMPTSQHLAIFRVTPEVAASTAEGVKNLFALVEKYSNGNLAVVESKEGDANVYGITLPDPSPFQPAVAHLGEILVISSSKDLLEKSLKMLTGGEGVSKFDDPRLATALQHLPEAEDSLVFYDGKSQFATLRGLGPFIQTMGGGDENVDRVVKILDKVWDDVAIIDYEVTVQYTEGNLNRTASYGQLLPGTDDATLRKMLSSGQPFEKWNVWVPAGALAYSLGTGVNLHPLYERIMAILKEDVPESAAGLEQFEQIQQQLDLHLDQDILQAFSGEYASISMPAATDKVVALRCTKADRIKELLHRGIDALQQLEPVKAQNLKLVESKDLPGFEELTAAMLTAYGVHPVIGFQDDWMYIGSSTAAVKKVLDTKAGKGETIEGTEAFKRLKLEVVGPVRSIAYTNTAESIRNAAQGIKQIGDLAPMILMMAGGQIDQEQLKPIQEALALLPDISKIVGKFDFLEANVTVVQAGEEPDTYVKRAVTVVRPIEAEATKAEATKAEPTKAENSDKK
ncbi:MAG: hypothetical protein ACYC3X_25535 [Pirellulaceae bacterium]